MVFTIKQQHLFQKIYMRNRGDIVKIKIKIVTNENMEYFNVAKNTEIEVEFEEYVAAVVASEVGNAALEVCKAQAVAARSFAISRGVLRDKSISDSSATAQAYRAKRYDSKSYGNAIKGTNATIGEVLMYNDTVINSIYTAANGGRTVSAEEQWGSPYPFLIAQDDPWDKAAGYKKSGTGVGMSQRGAMYAAKQGIDYKTILAFYYPKTVIEQEYGDTKARKVVALAKESLGHPYVFAALGEACTPANRRKRERSDYPEIVTKCQVLSGKKSNCEGCKYKGSRIYDCRGFTYYCLKQNGVTISNVGATTQWNTASWLQKGEIAKGLPNLVCCLFKKKGDKMSHTGLHIGDGIIIHCSGEVKYGSITDTGWTHYAIPIGLYTKTQLETAPEVKVMATLKSGSSGEAVRQLQSMLNALGYDCGTVDGKFGAKTGAALRLFQADHKLTVDGIYGKASSAMLEEEYNKKMNKNKSDDEEPIGIGDDGDPTPMPIISDDKYAELLATLTSLQKSLKTLTTKVNNFEKTLDSLK